MGRRMLAAALLWIAVALAALVLVVVALNVAGVEPFGPAGTPISEAQADALLAGLPSAGPPPSPATSAAPSSPAPVSNPSLVVTAGGMIGISCLAGVVKLDYESPSPGYVFKVASIGSPADLHIAELGPAGAVISVEARCQNGVPETAVK